jgi:hypothetical protein
MVKTIKKGTFARSLETNRFLLDTNQGSIVQLVLKDGLVARLRALDNMRLFSIEEESKPKSKKVYGETRSVIGFYEGFGTFTTDDPRIYVKISMTNGEHGKVEEHEIKRVRVLKVDREYVL